MRKKPLNTIDKIDFGGKSVLVRGDFDVDDGDNPRAASIRKVVLYLIGKEAKRIRVIGHTETKYDLVAELEKEYPSVEFYSGLRDDLGEKTNNDEFAARIAENFLVYINEAFATSHRSHASIVALPKLIRSRGGEVCVGMRFELELEKLRSVLQRPGRRVLVIGGVKIEDKQKFAANMGTKFDAVLLGGKLPGADLRSDGLDISDAAIEAYKQEIGKADVILAAGVMGKYEDPDSAKGTTEILGAIAASKAYKVAGGGDIEMAISSLGLADRFDWISVGGGAMLEYLGAGTLVGLEALES